MPKREPKQVSELHIVRTRNGKMTHLSYTPGDEKERALVESLPGARPQGQGKEIRFNVDRFVVDMLRTTLNGALVLLADTQQWYDDAVHSHRDILHLSQQQDVDLPVEVSSHLRDYQRIGAAWLAQVKRGLLGDEMGLGKTLEALVATKLVGAKRVLIVTMAISKWQWQDEIKRWLGEDAVVVDGNETERKKLIQSNAKYLIIHYDILRGAVTRAADKKTGKDAIPAKYPELIRTAWDVAIFDEAHKLQGRNSLQSEAAYKVARSSTYVFELTGTPIWNMPQSLWHLLHVLNPSVLSSFNVFTDRYCYVKQGNYGREVGDVRPEMRDELQERIAGYKLQRKKIDVAPELPPIIETVYTYQLSPQQVKVYQKVEKELLLEREQGPLYFSNVPSAAVTLRRLCNNPRDLGLNFDSPKDDLLLRLIQNVLEQAPKVAVLCWHKDYARHIGELLQDKGISFAFATGDIEARERIQAVETFKHDDTCVLIGTIAAIGTAVNLKEVTHAIFTELYWIPPLNDQAKNRFHRLTSTETVNISYIIGRGTIEEDIYNTMLYKADITDLLLAVQAVVERILARSSQKA